MTWTKNYYNLFYTIARLEKIKIYDEMFETQSVRYTIAKDFFNEITLSSGKTSMINEKWLFDVLPDTVKHKILMKLDHTSLILFGFHCPKYLNDVFNPVYWSHIDTTLDDNIFSLKEIAELAKYLNKNLKRLSLAIYNVKLENDSCLNEIFSACFNLRELNFSGVLLSSGINMVCSNLKSLSHLELTYMLITSEHLIQITDNLKCITSLFVNTSNNIDEGLIYFLNNVSYLDQFGMKVSSSDEKVYKLLFKLHCRTLRKLKYKLFDKSTDNEFLKQLAKCTILESLYLFDITFDALSAEIIFKLNSIKCLIVYLSYPIDPRFCVDKDYSQMTQLSLCGVRLYDSEASLFSTHCPNLEFLSLYCVLTTDLCLSILFSKLIKLKSIHISKINSISDKNTLNYSFIDSIDFTTLNFMIVFYLQIVKFCNLNIDENDLEQRIFNKFNNENFTVIVKIDKKISFTNVSRLFK